MARYEPRRLTEGFITSLPQDGRSTYIVRDTKVTGLMVAVNKLSKTYKVQRDLWRGERGRRRLVKTVRVTLGTNEEVSLEEARFRAQELIGQIARGSDPNDACGQSSADTWTVETSFNEYAADMRKRDCSEVTISNMVSSVERYLADWKHLRLTELSRSRVRGKQQELSVKRGKVVANKAMRDLRAAYNLALRVIDNPDLIPDNPVKAVTFNKERRSVNSKARKLCGAPGTEVVHRSYFAPLMVA